MDEYQKQIDSLLERYLAFLDEYTQLRGKLSQLQSGIYQNIARANFSAERGLRYGQDQYDERMQASRVLQISVGDEDGGEDENELPGFRVVDSESLSSSKDEAGEQPQDEGDTEKEVEEKESSSDQGENDKPGSEEKAKSKEEEEEKEEEKKAQPPKRKDPLFWFGVLAPAPLRNAQALSVEAIEQVIPRLVAVNAQMSHLEIEVRRARKKRAKALEKKQKTDGAAAGTEEVEARIATMSVEAT